MIHAPEMPHKKEYSEYYVILCFKNKLMTNLYRQLAIYHQVMIIQMKLDCW